MKTFVTAICCLALVLAALTAAHGRGRGMADALEQYQQELEKWLAEVKAHPKDATAWFNLGTAYEHLQQEDEGQAKELAAYSEAIRLNPDYGEAYKKRARIYLNTSKHEKAVADYAQLIRLDPKDAYAYVMRAGGYASMKDNDKALADYNEAIRVEPKFAQAYYGRGVIYEEKGETDKAVADYTSAIQFAKAAAPGRPAEIEDAFDTMGDGALDRRARLYLQTAQWDKAIAEYSGMIQPANEGDGDYDYYDVYICRALAYRGKGENEKAIADYTAAAKADSAEQADRDFAHVGRGEVYAAMGEKEKAMADFSKAVELHPYTDDYIELAITQYSAGQFDNVIKTCSTEIEVCDAGIDAYELRGAARAAKGDAKKATEDYKEAVERGREACQENKWKNAEEIDGLAEAEARMGKFDMAVIHEQMALELAHAGKTDAKLTKAMEERLALYQQKKPYLMEMDKNWVSPASDMLPMDF